jgi:putative membrane-bound dehydrogenase-like protein
MKWTALVVLGLGIGPNVLRADDGPPVLLGVARVDVTPDGPIRLHGYQARDRESTGVAQRIWAKALAIGSDEQGATVLVALDNLGVPEALTNELAHRLERVGLTRERLAIAASHTHSAPCLTGVAPNIFGKPLAADQQKRVDDYTRKLIDQLETVCLDALKDRRPGRLAWTQGQVGFAANRRTPGGPVDHSLLALRATALDGKLRAVLTSYACHCTTIAPQENQVDGDWAGYAQAAIEADNPGCVALTVIGCGADANPTSRTNPGTARAHGRALADEVARLLRGPWIPLTGPPRVALERLTLPLDTLPTVEELERLMKTGGAPGYNASTQLARLKRGEPLENAIPYSVQCWRFGDGLAMVFLPGEVVVDYVVRLKRELDPARLWVTAYANDLPCYIPSERILREGGYEGGGAMVYYGRPTRLKPGLEALIVSAIHRVVGEGFHAPPAPPADPDRPPPLTPEASRQSFRVKPGLKVELVASEPLVESPVAIDFGADGRLWVCEMRDYPAGLDGKYQPGGAIKVLEDRDRDGRYETATTFLDGLPFPTGVMEWRRGVLICAAPEIFYAEDTDGDGKADLRKTLFRGFATGNYQARVNGLFYGLDNWVYGANGLIGGKIQGVASGREVDIGGRDFRLLPDTGAFEPASGLSQQGRFRDDWGNAFGNSNGVLLQHYPLPDHEARRNPRVASPSPIVSLASGDEATRLYPASRTLARFNSPESANRVTSACGPGLYRDTVLGTEYAGNAFVCEPVHNLVRRLVLDPAGVTFTARKPDDERATEFLASTDSWSRPVQARTGPDGALWVVDMYRFVIEHPRWISPERLATLDVRAGADKGRIYRVVPEDRPLRPVPRLDALSTCELATALDVPNGTLRDTIHRLIVHRSDPAAAPVLAELVANSRHPECRVQSLGVLDGLGVLEASTIRRALQDPHPGVRREAARLAGARVAREPGLASALRALADDAEITVRYQAALALAESPGVETSQALARVALRDPDDVWIRAAVLCASIDRAPEVLAEVARRSGPDGPPRALVEALMATAIGGDRAGIDQALAVVGPGETSAAPLWRLAAVASLLEASKDDRLAEDPRIVAATTTARRVASDRSASATDRTLALRLLGLLPSKPLKDRDLIIEQLDPGEPTEVQLAAIRALGRPGDRAGADAILERWAKLGPVARASALDVLMARSETTGLLLGALETGRVAPNLIDAAHRERLLRKGAGGSRPRAEALFATRSIGPRQGVIEAYASARTRSGDVSRGRNLFEKACAGCHRVAGLGQDVGPDLAALTDQSPSALLTAILDPNREVDARYAAYAIALKDGRVTTGMIAAETASAITLKQQGGQTETVLRAAIDDLTTSGRSLMPEGLENDLSPADLADLIAFLRQGTSH